MSNHSELTKLLDWIKDRHGVEKWTTVYELSKNDHLKIAYYSSFVNNTKSKSVLKDYQWDVNIGHGYPNIETTFSNGKAISKYHRYSYLGFPPLVILRRYDLKEPTIEISEEFRLFHNLYYDPSQQTYLSFDDAGDEIEVIKVTADRVQIKTNYLYMFMVEAHVNIVLFFDCTLLSSDKMEFDEIQKRKNLIYSIHSGEGNSQYFSLLMGKKLITYDSIKLPDPTQKIYQEFCIGGDEVSPVLSTCNPNELDDFFIRKLNASGHYLTPVFFKKTVLNYYYENSSEYTVTEATVSRRGCWYLQIDNHSPDYVAAYLGDLGKLPPKIQSYWKSFNIIPDGHRISQIYAERTLQANFVEATRSDHVFKKAFNQLSKQWHKKFQWDLFKPLDAQDMHHLANLRYMLTEEQSEFDSLVGSLAKILNDSINVEKIECYLGKKMEDNKPIMLLNDFLIKLGFEFSSNFKNYLQKVQTLRSTGTVHRKGENYRKALKKYNVSHNNLSSYFNILLLEGGDLLSRLCEKIS